MNDAITDLQIRVTHQEAAIDELTRTVLEQQRLIDALREQLRLTRDQVAELAAQQPAGGTEPPPPHY